VLGQPVSTAQRRAREGHIVPRTPRPRRRPPPRGIPCQFAPARAAPRAHPGHRRRLRATRVGPRCASRHRHRDQQSGGDRRTRALEQRRFGVLVRELLPPDIDGVNVVRQLPPAYRPRRVVVVTAWLGAAPIARALGAHEFFAKPCSSRRLRYAVLTASKQDEVDRRA
jgi:DNA-binding NarL/FixJ family response regulator